MKRVSIVFGTRPEAIKLAPLILALREHPTISAHVCVTGQHREMLHQVLDVFGILPEIDLDLMAPNQSLAGLTARAVRAIDGYLAASSPDLVLVQGDTTTTFCAALCAFYHRIPVGHVEAGLRTWNRYSPYPEEMNRLLTSRLADYHFAPTEKARQNLFSEGLQSDRIFVTGNTVIDALFLALRKLDGQAAVVPGLPPDLITSQSSRPLVLVTGHRRENLGGGIESICLAVAELAEHFPLAAFVYPVHLNPSVRNPVRRLLAGRENVYLIEPVGYLPFVALMNRATIILTDSGGVQEEAPSLGKPVLVTRDTTERPEAVEAGTVKLVGTDVGRIVDGVSSLLTDAQAYSTMARAINPYGDGKAAQRILQVCERILER